MNDVSNIVWPYPLEYEKETDVSIDVLVLKLLYFKAELPGYVSSVLEEQSDR
jgi:hypothetical protein